MDINDGTDLAALHQAIVDESASAFPGVHFEFYREDRKNLPMGNGSAPDRPKAYGLLNLEEFDHDVEYDPGTEQMPVVARFECELVVPSLNQQVYPALTKDGRLAVRVLAGAYAAFLRKQLRFPGVLNGPVRLRGCYKDDFSPELDQFEVWKVEWSQELYLGAGVWANLGAVPQAFYSFAPLIGTPHVDEYKAAA